MCDQPILFSDTLSVEEKIDAIWDAFANEYRLSILDGVHIFSLETLILFIQLIHNYLYPQPAI